MVSIRRDISEGMHGDIDITNHCHKRVVFRLMLAVRSDFANIFEVKARNIIARGRSETVWKEGKLITDYCNESFYRSITIEPVCFCRKKVLRTGKPSLLSLCS